ncbi:MAG: hypothetical protein NZ736_02130, partial [Candidatus Poseidoniaceae archaeon]|nr:hypothetical protein [Candidatus Poseidoniaceae archaeon]
MTGTAGLNNRNNPYFITAMFIVSLLLITSYLPVISNSHIDDSVEDLPSHAGAFPRSSETVEHWSGPDSFHPISGQSGVNQTLYSSIQIPYNQTVSSAEISIQPLFTSINTNGTMFGPESSN